VIAKVLDWLGFGPHGHGQHDHDQDHAHGHTHGVVDPTLATTDRGIWAIKWSFLILAATAALQLVVVYVSNSVALLADTIHNIADAGTAIPLWVAFVLARRKPTQTFTYGYGRVEDFAGLAIVLIILLSALVAGYEAVDRLIHPRPVMQLGWLAAAGVIGFLGNEAVGEAWQRELTEASPASMLAVICPLWKTSIWRWCLPQAEKDLSTIQRPNTSTITEPPTSNTIPTRCRQPSVRSSSPIKRSRAKAAASAMPPMVAIMPTVIAAVTASPDASIPRASA
jgi:hypothetical protein